MKIPMQQLFTVPKEILNDARQKILNMEATEGYSFKLQAWKRVDSYAFNSPPDLSKYVGSDLVDYVISKFPDDVLFGWSLSLLPSKEKVIEHTDRMFFHRFAKRIIVPIDGTKDVLNWSYDNDKKTRRYYLMPEGFAYQLNTAITHGLSNNGPFDRRAVYFDMIDQRLNTKFSSHPDLKKVILQQNTGVIHVL